ncbi:MAG: alpha/beta hydrolase [Myxococcota bacterium]
MSFRSCIGLLLFTAACGSSSPGGGPDLDGADVDGTDVDGADVDDLGDVDLPGDSVVGGDGSTSTQSSIPANPVAFAPGERLTLQSSLSEYFVVVPRAYDATHQTPTQLFIYLHGCGATSGEDVWAASNMDTTWIGMAPGGNEGPCWDDQAHGAELTMSALADLKTHFNIDPRRVHIGGYSSGGDLSYYTAFRNALSFAGVLAYNSSPAYTMPELQQGISAAAWAFNIVHLSQTEDGVYPIADVREQMTALTNAGFNVLHIERPGLHYDDNTTGYRNELVYPHLNDGWHAP